MLFQLMRFHYTASHVPGKDLTTADALSRAPQAEATQKDNILCREVNTYVCMVVVENLPATEERIREIQTCQEENGECRQIRQYCREGWPAKSALKGGIKKYTAVAHELTVNKGVLLRGSRLVIPASLQADVLDKLHSGHQGITKCRQRARDSLWWPGIGRQLEERVRNCQVCTMHRFQPAEPLIPSTLPEYPWERIATDLFEWKKSSYLLLVDYYSRFIEIVKLSSTTSVDVIRHMKSLFARYGIPKEIVSDNGPQHGSELFPVKIVKALLEKNEDPYLGLLAYRLTPLENGYSPAELLMGRKLRSSTNRRRSVGCRQREEWNSCGRVSTATDHDI